MGKYILIKDNKVQNVIIAEQDFINAIQSDYDSIIDFDEHSQNPNPGDDVFFHDHGDITFHTLIVEPDEDIIEGEVISSTPIEKAITEQATA